MNQSDRTSKIALASSYVVAGIFILLPFHAVFTTWLGANFGYIDLFRIWKELIIFGVLFPIAIYISYKEVLVRKWIKSSWLATLLIFYVILHLVFGYLALSKGQVTLPAYIFAMLINLRFLGFFAIVVVIAHKSDYLLRHWKYYIVWPALIVVAFGVLQRFILPYDFLKHLGYGPNTIPAYQTVDQKLAYRRIQSTLRGANPLGAYLVLLIPFFAITIRNKGKRIAVILASLTVLFYTYSRSAWLGLFLTLGLLVFWRLRSRQRTVVAGFVALCVVLGTFGVYVARDSNFVQNSLFHTDESSKSSVSSNASRLQQTKQATKDIIREPLGRGPGTAGPASFRNDKPARISENYFLQIGQEVGLLGMATFVAINLFVIRALWRQRAIRLAQILLVTWAGISFINLVSHAWTDDTLVYLWWGLAGVATTPAILNEKRKRYAKN